MSLILNKKYKALLTNLKEKIRQARIDALFNLNTQLLSTYWEIGNAISKQESEQGWGAKIVDILSSDLQSEFPDMKGLSPRNLRYMRDFAVAHPQFSILQAPLAKLKNKGVKNYINPILQAPLAKLSWYHHITLLEKVKDPEVRMFYINKTAENGWSRNVMVHQIESGLHKRQGKLISNFKKTIAPIQSELVQQLFKDPYTFDFISLTEEAKERDLEEALMTHVTKFLLELGQWFAFMGRQYKMTLGKKEYSIDLLFYHTRMKRYIIIDLKIDEFKPEYAGKMDFYLNIADDMLRYEGDNESIGLILCKTKDGLVAEYALKSSRKPIGIAEYKIGDKLPANIQRELPSIAEIESRLEEKMEELGNPSGKTGQSKRLAAGRQRPARKKAKKKIKGK